MSKESSSNIPKLEIPEFVPAVPEYMLDNVKDKSIKYIIEQMSVLTQQTAWSTHKISNIYDYTRKINGSVVELEKFRNDLLLQLKVEQDIEKEKERESRKSRISARESRELEREKQRQVKESETIKRKYIKTAVIVFLAILYPLYLAFVNTSGLGTVMKTFF
tara:strand:- start:5905 stop:6390 length:486 start_codon:yes stop_codon:yes gene_type:complete